ncbi:ABC transporter ATP-binding protein [Clostridium hydrogenum]|uniref:ABC transporter ATP-binding protein n=1 Tax=Clostridium hydrogenum TaxID=2855764 RepID=UPI001F404890|nr:ABC transporter ATP-binding protein [Clostridium hydrogenum]
MNIVELKNITKRYDDKLVVDNINMNIEKGEIFGLLGPNGAGKSTLISMVCGLVKKDKGIIKIGNYDIDKQKIKAKEYIGLVPQEICLYEDLSGYDNLNFWGSMYKLRGAKLKERMDEVIEAAGLNEKIREKVKTYSGGMKRRLNIAAAVMHHPEIIIMDEPTVGIDPQSRNHILEYTMNLNKKLGTTIIYTTHYMEEAEHLCSKLAIMDEGKIIAYGSKEDIKRMVTDEENAKIFVEGYKEEMELKLKEIEGVRKVSYSSPELSLVLKNSSESLNYVIENLIKFGVKIKNVNMEAPSLENVFLSLTGKSLRD